LVAFVVGALCAVFAVPAAVAKEGVRARLNTPLPVAARPGTTITVGWTLSYSNYGTHRPFDAYGLFVRLVSASGGTSTRAPGEGSAGRYVARVVVPAGGIARIEFGLEGWKSLADGSSAEADAYFPLENDPFRTRAGTRRGSTAARTTNTGWPAPIWVAAAGLVYAVAVGISVSRRLARQTTRTGHQDERGAY
jgi:hypothetical protein